MKLLSRLGLTVLAALPAAVHAQQPPRATTGGNAIEAPPVIITGNPLGSALLDMVRPADVLEGAKLGLRLESTLGETLANETGVSSSYFGPNASRPIIRGLDGERVRILQNGTGVLDASGSSPDHGVAVEPLTVDRIEIVRGPATLLYGGSAIGGVVNSIDNRIPSFAPDKGIGGAAQLRFGGAADERAGVVKLDGGTERFALHVDAFRRDTSDLRIPGLAWSARKIATDPTNPDNTARDRLPNSASTSDGMAVGGSALFERGHLGISAAQYNNNYGTVVERAVTIDQRQNRYDLAGEMRDLGFIETAKLHAGYTDYRHTEFDGPDPGTTFKHKGYDARLDLRHRKVGLLEGAFGFQLQNSRFQALGDEAFVPPVSTRTASAFVYEEAPVGPLRFSAGARVDSVRMTADEVLPNFTPTESRDFTASSGSVGALYPFGGEYAVAANVSYTERAPNYAEVFANGPHIATGQFECGQPRGSGWSAPPPSISPCASAPGRRPAASASSRSTSRTSSRCSPPVPSMEAPVCRSPASRVSGPTSGGSRQRHASTSSTLRTASSTSTFAATTRARRTPRPPRRCRASPRCGCPSPPRTARAA